MDLIDLQIALEETRVFLHAFGAKKPKIKKFKDGWVINGEFGSPEVDDALEGILKGDKLSLIIADPPYGSIVSNDWDKGVKSNDYIRWTEAMKKWLIKGGSAYVWGGIGKPHDRVFFEYLATVEEKTGMTMRNLITWSKRRAYGKKDDYLFTREECAWLINGEKPKTFHIPLLEKERGYAGYNPDYPAKSKFLRRTNIWTDISELFSGKVHIAQKPEKLAEIMISVHTNPKKDVDDAAIVMDPFAGSGSTAFACRTLGRRFILIERDAGNFKLICDRLAAWKPKTASMEGLSVDECLAFYAGCDVAEFLPEEHPYHDTMQKSSQCLMR